MLLLVAVVLVHELHTVVEFNIGDECAPFQSIMNNRADRPQSEYFLVTSDACRITYTFMHQYTDIHTVHMHIVYAYAASTGLLIHVAALPNEGCGRDFAWGGSHSPRLCHTMEDKRACKRWSPLFTSDVDHGGTRALAKKTVAEPHLGVEQRDGSQAMLSVAGLGFAASPECFITGPSLRPGLIYILLTLELPAHL